MREQVRSVHPQDENSSGFQHFPSSTLKENQLDPTRKSFGGLKGRSFGSEAVHPAKNPSLTARKAFGDITNGSAIKSQNQHTVVKGSIKEEVCTTEPRLDDLARAQPEKLAGKGWKELELDRLAREDDDISERLASFAKPSALQSFFPWSSFSYEKVDTEMPTSPQSLRARSPSSLSLGDYVENSLVLPELDILDEF